MTILRERVEWRQPPTPKRLRRGITPAAQRNVAAALKALRVRFGSWVALAEAMGSTWTTLRTVATPTGSTRLGAGIAVRAARVAGVSVDRILRGQWPRADACPRCGHVTRRSSRARIQHA